MVLHSIAIQPVIKQVLTASNLTAQEYRSEMEELMEWMHDADGDSNNGLDPLLALADQAEMQATPAAPSQKVRRFPPIP